MRNTERKKIEVAKSGNQIWGHISLDDLAIPESMRITINGDKIKPSSFDIYGSPNFSKELALYYEWKEQEIRRKKGKDNFILKAEVTYEARAFDVPRDKFDSKEGITKSLNSLQSFTEMLDNRLIFKTKFSDSLSEFVVWGKFLLDAEGRVWLRNSPLESSVVIPNVITKKNFEQMVISSGKNEPHYTIAFHLPRVGYICPCCGRKFTIDDLKNSSFGIINEKVTHKTCFDKFKTQKEIHFFCSLIDQIYEKPKFEISNQEDESIYTFHTEDGDIQLSKNYDTISIKYLDYLDTYEICETSSETVAYNYLHKTHKLLKK